MQMIELKVNEQIFNGWKTARVKRQINAFSSFDLTVSTKFIDGSIDIPLDAPCKILIDEKIVISGYIDEIKPNYSATAHEITFSGRSRAAVLVDCAAIFKTGQIMDAQIDVIIRQILQPYNIKLIFEAEGGFVVPDFQLQQGETALSAIERLCAMFSLVYFDDENGNLVISQVRLKKSIGSLIHKVMNGSKNNILSGSCTYSRRDRFSEYIVKSQTSGSDFMGGEAISGVVGRAVDGEVKRYRPLVLLAESAMDAQAAKARAEWEKTTRAGKSIAINYVVQGWNNGEGVIWSPNSYVEVEDDFIQIKGKLIISEVDLSTSESGGTISSLTLSPPEAFIPISAKQNVKTFSAWKELKEGV